MATMRPFGFPGGAAPFRELRRLRDEMDRLAGALAPAGGATAAAGFPAVNLYAGRDGVAVVAEVPGVEAGDLEVQAHGDTLTIAGTRRPAAEDARAYHVLAFQGGHAIGTGRLVMLPEPPPGASGTWAQIGRMAVLKAHRKARVGAMLLTTLEDEARRRGVSGIMLHSQLYALEFYKKQGYEPVGEVFQEAGIEHLEMRKKF